MGVLNEGCYLSGCEWHPRIKARRNHFIYNDFPQFIMDSYEECRDPPCLHLLDKYVKFSFNSLPLCFLLNQNSKGVLCAKS